MPTAGRELQSHHALTGWHICKEHVHLTPRALVLVHGPPGAPPNTKAKGVAISAQGQLEDTVEGACQPGPESRQPVQIPCMCAFARTCSLALHLLGDMRLHMKWDTNNADCAAFVNTQTPFNLSHCILAHTAEARLGSPGPLHSAVCENEQ